MKSKSNPRSSMKSKGGSMRATANNNSNSNSNSQSSKSSLSTTHIIILLGMVVVLSLIYYYIYVDNMTLGSIKSALHIENFTQEDIDVSNDEVVLALFYADWCPHCVKFKPAWDEMSSKVSSGSTKTKSGKKVKMVKVNADENKALCNKYGVDGYPSIKIITMNGGKKAINDYSGARTMDGLEQQLNSL